MIIAKEREVTLMNKTVVFDMDGTIADLYGVDNWLEMLQKEDPTPYITAEALCDIADLKKCISALKMDGWKIVVTSWLAKGSSTIYDGLVRQAKIDWLDKIGFDYDEIHLVKYGTTKANCTRKHGGYQVLVDDNEKVRKGWTLGDTIDPTATDICEALLNLLMS
jgi:hypothetical protein